LYHFRLYRFPFYLFLQPRVILQHIVRNGLPLDQRHFHDILVPLRRAPVDDRNAFGGRRRIEFVFIARHLPRFT
jgi:hypothetical protein